jgi:hypothetical protein
MLFGEIVAVYCKSHTKHTDTLYGQNAIRTSQESHYVSATEPNLLMLFRETVVVYCENHLRYRAQPVNAVWGNSRCLL